VFFVFDTETYLLTRYWKLRVYRYPKSEDWTMLGVCILRVLEYRHVHSFTYSTLVSRGYHQPGSHYSELETRSKICSDCTGARACSGPIVIPLWSYSNHYPSSSNRELTLFWSRSLLLEMREGQCVVVCTHKKFWRLVMGARLTHPNHFCGRWSGFSGSNIGG
jgi:hypothetical protein